VSRRRSHHLMKRRTLQCIAVGLMVVLGVPACCPDLPRDPYRDDLLSELLACITTERGLTCADKYGVVTVSGRVAMVLADGPHLQLLIDDGTWPAVSGRLICNLEEGIAVQERALRLRAFQRARVRGVPERGTLPGHVLFAPCELVNVEGTGGVSAVLGTPRQTLRTTTVDGVSRVGAR